VEIGWDPLARGIVTPGGARKHGAIGTGKAGIGVSPVTTLGHVVEIIMPNV
jgi:hypothetical protein